MTFNIQHGVEGLNRIASLLRDQAADLIFLQEVDKGCRRSGGVDQAQVLAEALGFHHVFGEAMPFDGGSYGLAILAQSPLTPPRLHHLPHHGPVLPDGSGEPRIVLCAEVGDLTVCSTHLGLGEEERLEQADALGRFLRRARNSVILGGDFNEGPDDPAVRRTRTWARDAFRDASGVESSTAPSDRPNRRIDFILYTDGGPAPRIASIGPRGFSDHRPVIVDFEA